MKIAQAEKDIVETRKLPNGPPRDAQGNALALWRMCSRCFRPFLKTGAMRCPCRAASSKVD